MYRWSLIILISIFGIQAHSGPLKDIYDTERKEKVAGVRIKFYDYSQSNCRSYHPNRVNNALNNSTDLLFMVKEGLDRMTTGESKYREKADWHKFSSAEKGHQALVQYKNAITKKKQGFEALLNCGWQVGTKYKLRNSNYTWSEDNIKKINENLSKLNKILSAMPEIEKKFTAALSSQVNKSNSENFDKNAYQASLKLRGQKCKGISPKLYYAYKTSDGRVHYNFCDGTSVTKKKNGQMGFGSGNLNNFPGFSKYIKNERERLEQARKEHRRFRMASTKKAEDRALAAYRKKSDAFRAKHFKPKSYYYKTARNSKIKINSLN